MRARCESVDAEIAGQRWSSQNKTFTACPFSNEVIAGHAFELQAQQFGYDKIAAGGVTVMAQAATKIDAADANRSLADGTSLSYDRLVLSPGVDLRFDALHGYDEAALRQDAACLESRRADDAAAQADRGHGRWRPGGDRGARRLPSAARPGRTNAPA